MRKIVVTFGLIAGAILSVMMMTSAAFIDSIGFDKAAIVGYTTMVLAFMMIFFGVKSYRDTVDGGRIGFGRAFSVGILITAIGSLCYVATWQVLYQKVWPDFGDRYAAHIIEKARASGKPAAEIAKQEEQMAKFKEMYKNPLVRAAFTFLEPLPVGLIITLVTAGVLRRRTLLHT